MSAALDLAVWSPRLLEMESELKKDFPGRPEVVSRVARGIRKKLALLGNKPWPLASFVCVGPKEKAHKLASGLSRFLYGDTDAVLRLDMKEYAEKYQISTLIGHSGGLVAPFFVGTLTEPVWRRPRTVIVLEDIDKAHQDFWKILVPILEEGVLVEGMGRTVRFKESVLILTTMVGFPTGVVEPDCVVQSDGSFRCRDVYAECREALEVVLPPWVFRLLGDLLVLQ